MRKKVLLINRGSDTDNVGDQAINYTIKSMLENNCAIVTSKNYTLFFRKRGNKVVSFLNNLWKAISIVRVGYDIVIIGGGQLILSNKSFPISFFLWTTIIRTFSNSKVVVFGVGVDDRYTYVTRTLFKEGLRRIDRIYVRDNVSRKNLEMIFSRDCKVIPDPVFGISQLYSPTKCNDVNALFGITTYSSIARYGYIKCSEYDYLEKQAAHVLELGKMNYNVKLISNTKEDYKYSLELQRILNEKYNFDVDVLDVYELETFIDLISSAKLVVSSRMHSLIIAKSYGVEIKPIVRNKKLLTFKNEHMNISIADAYRTNNDEVKLILDDC